MKEGRFYYIFSDLDGTLGVEGAGIPSKNRQAIREFVEQGGKFGVCTGRSPQSAKAFLQDIPVNVPSVVNGGCTLCKLDTGETWEELEVPEQALPFALAFMKDFPEISLVIVNNEGYWQAGAEGDSVTEHKYPVLPIEKIAKPWYRVIFMADPKGSLQIAQKAQKCKPAGVRIEHTAPDFVEIMHEGAGKYTALKRLCAYMDISLSQVVFVGDFYNDLEVIKHVGLSACVAGAPKEVKECCTWVLSDCMEGAVAELIERLQF